VRPGLLAASPSAEISQNIAAVYELFTREEHKRSPSQCHAESIDRFVGRPAFLVAAP
jgi:hypothetical protein